MRGQDRRPRFRAAVYAGRAGMTDGCRVLLLHLADSMDSNGFVSIPRTKLATRLGVAPARISERIKLARALGFLDIAEPARPRWTAVYQATIPDGWEVRPPVTVTGTESVPLPEQSHAHEGYACTPPSSKRTPNRHAVGDLPDEKQHQREARGQSRDNGQAEVANLGNETRSEERSA